MSFFQPSINLLLRTTTFDFIYCNLYYNNMYKAQIGNLHTNDFERDWWWPIGRNIVVCFMYAPITDNTTYDYYK